MFEKLKKFYSTFKKSKLNLNFGQFLNGGVVFWNKDPETLLNKGYANNPHVYSVVNKIMRSAGRIDIDLYNKKNGGKEKIYNHPALELINQPNPRQGKSEFFEELIGWKLGFGECFIHVLSPDNGVNAGKPKQLDIIPAVLVKKINFNDFGDVISYEIGLGNKKQTISEQNIIHLKYWNPTNGARGLSPIQAAADSLQISTDSYANTLKSVQNGTIPGILSGVNDGYSLSTEEAKLIQDKFYQNYGGRDNSGKIIVTGAELKWEKIGLSPIDLNTIEQNKWSLRDICNIYGVSSRLFNDPESNNGATMKEIRADFILNVVEPEMDNILDELSRVILKKFNRGADNLKFETNTNDFSELKSDFQKQAQALNSSWWLTPNQKLEIMGFEKSDKKEMENIYLPSGLMPIDQTFNDLQNAITGN